MKKLEMSWNELWPLGNILNEVCHGIKIDIQSKIGFSYEEVYELLKKIKAYKVNEYEEDIKKEITFRNEEILILKRSIHEVALQIEEWEFQTRIGITLGETKKLDFSIFQSSFAQKPVGLQNIRKQDNYF